MAPNTIASTTPAGDQQRWAAVDVQPAQSRDHGDLRYDDEQEQAGEKQRRARE
ncbi:MAG: hypothetical protein WDN76_07320 [Alphaproteobacteria bacterium]